MPDDKDLISRQEAGEAVEAAHLAWTAVGKFDQAKIDRICGAMANAALAEAARLGAMAHEETGFGKAEDKYEKNRFAAENVWNHFKNLKTVGIVKDNGSVVEIASPRGVVAAIIPSTNPTSTAIFKIIIAIKSRNTIVLSPHPSAARSIAETARIMRDAGVKEGLPPDAVRCLTISALEGTESLMKHKKTAVILATGGTGLVRAAYSSGKPAFGVGPGNVPVFVERTANVEKAVSDILTGTCFDNGTICASEQAVVADAPVAEEVREQLVRQGGHFLNAEEAEKVGAVLITPQRTLNPKIVGKSAEHIANLAGISVPSGVRCLIADCGGVGRDYPWSFEKLSPTLAFFVVDGIEAGAGKCLEILQFGGMGHTAGMHTQSRQAAIRYGEQMPASRVIINSPTTHGAIGFSTELSPSMTLGCGSWGGNVTSDNVSPIHLMDIKRVAFETKPVSSEVQDSKFKVQSLTADPQNSAQNVVQPGKSPAVKREEIAALVDKFLSVKLAEYPAGKADLNANAGINESVDKLLSAKFDENRQSAEIVAPAACSETTAANFSPVKTIIHEIRPQIPTNGNKPRAVDFVSETEVRKAIENGEKIFVNGKTIITPSARDLGEEKDVFARI